MQAAMSSQRIARNLPWVNRYVLQVSQIELETFAMLSWTGRALVWVYWISPKTAPTKHRAMPMYISEIPLRPPRPSNLTWVRSGILISASLARNDTAGTEATARAIDDQRSLDNFIICEARGLYRRIPT